MHVQIDSFAEPEFIAVNKSFFDRYIKLRVQGHSPHASFMRTFGPDHMPENGREQHARLEAIENTEYFSVNFDAALESTPVAKMWNPKRSLNELLCVVRGPMVKDRVKLGAIKELNIMVGIVIIDENGKTKAGRSLEDFYAGLDGAAPTKADTATAKPA